MENIDKQTLYKNLNEGIIEERYRAFQLNLAKNKSLIENYGGLARVLPGFSDMHVIIVAAGPSLENELELLRKYQHRKDIVIIAVDMALKPLIAEGVMPGYVMSCETTPVDFYHGIDTKKIHLLGFSCMSHQNVKHWKGDISFYNWMIHNEYYDRLWDMAGRDLGFVATGNLVTTQAVSFALGCPVRSLLMMGNDLGFRKRLYVKGTSSYSQGVNNITRTMPVETGEFNRVRRMREYTITRAGVNFYTSSQFLAAKYWLEDLFVQHSIPVFDCSIPGCSEKSVKKISGKSYFEQFEKKRKRRRKK